MRLVLICGDNRKFDGDASVELLVLGEIHLAHTACAKWRNNFVATEKRAGSKGHLGMLRSVMVRTPRLEEQQFKAS